MRHDHLQAHMEITTRNKKRIFNKVKAKLLNARINRAMGIKAMNIISKNMMLQALRHCLIFNNF